MTFPDPSLSYRRWWSRVWGTTVGAGFGLSLLLWPLSTVAASFIVVSGLAGMFLLALPPDVDGSADVVTGRRSQHILGQATSFGAAFMAATAVGAVLVSLSALLVFMAAASSPQVVAFCSARVNGSNLRDDDADSSPTTLLTRAHRSVGSGTAEKRDDRCGASPPSQLDNQELCRAWRHSYLELQSSITVADLVRVVDLRRSYLDELHRRSPRALEAWLASGARAASGPDRYLLDDAYLRPPEAA